jgi:hypothetical protein
VKVGNRDSRTKEGKTVESVQVNASRVFLQEVKEPRSQARAKPNLDLKSEKHFHFISQEE